MGAGFDRPVGGSGTSSKFRASALYIFELPSRRFRHLAQAVWVRTTPKHTFRSLCGCSVIELPGTSSPGLDLNQQAGDSTSLQRVFLMPKKSSFVKGRIVRFNDRGKNCILNAPASSCIAMMLVFSGHGCILPCHRRCFNRGDISPRMGMLTRLKLTKEGFLGLLALPLGTSQIPLECNSPSFYYKESMKTLR